MSYSGNLQAYFVIVSFILPIFVAVTGSGTTKNLKEILIGRCWQYQEITKQNKLDNLKMNVNCNDLWTAFNASFAFKDPCAVADKDYDIFFNLLDNKNKIKNSLFWSGSHELVQQFTFINDDYIALEDTMMGYLLDSLSWCGSVSSHDGLNYTHCESSGSTCNAMYPAWVAASAKFADRAAGVAHTLLNATRSRNRPAYYDQGFFRTVEMPRLTVKKLVVYVASSIGQPIRERCGTRSLLELKADAQKKNIEFECIDQPKLVLRIFCIKYPEATPCTTGKLYIENMKAEETRLWKIICFALIAVAAVLLITIGFCMGNKYICKKNKKFKYNWSFSSTKPMISNQSSLDNNNEV